MSEVNKAKLQDISIKIGSGATPRGGKDAYKTEGISLIRSMNVYDSHFTTKNLAYIDDSQAQALSNVVVQKNDILLNITGASVARCCMVPKAVLPARVNQHVAIIRVDSKLADPKFVFLSLVSPKYKSKLLSLAQGGATREALTKSTIENFDVELPELKVQSDVADAVLTYDNLIENNNRRIAILEEMAQSLYREWFVKFRFPGHQQTKFIDSSLGEIPEGWGVMPLSSVMNVDRGRSYRSKELVNEGGYSFLNLKNVAREGGFRRDGLKRYDGPFKPHQIARPNDIIMAVTDMTQERAIIARSARVPNMGIDEFVFSMDLVKITVIDGYEESFIYSLLRYSDFPHVVKQFANGANVLHLNPKVIAEYEAAVPSKPLMTQFSDVVNPIHVIQDKLERKNDNLKKQRDVLLPKLISGKIVLTK